MKIIFEIPKNFEQKNQNHINVTHFPGDFTPSDGGRRLNKKIRNVSELFWNVGRSFSKELSPETGTTKATYRNYRVLVDPKDELE